MLKSKLVKGLKPIFRFVGFVSTVGCAGVLLVQLIGIFINGGLVIYELNKAIISFEIIMVLFIIIYLFYEFKIGFWDD